MKALITSTLLCISTLAVEQQSQELVKNSKSGQLSALTILQSKKWTNVFQEADEVQREIIWLLTGSRPLYNKTLYGKILRAKNQQQKIKLKDKSKHACDVYQIKAQEKYFQVFEFCQKYRAADLLAQVNIVNSYQLNTQFYGQNFSDVIGLNASLVAPKIDCDITISQNYILKRMECRSFKFTRKDQIVELSKFIFDKDSKPTISLEGQILENMLPYSKLSVIVPETGKIKIKETKLRPDADEFDPKKVKTTKEKDNTVPQPVNPKSETPTSGVVTNEKGEVVPPRELEQYIFTPEGEKINKQSDPDMIELNQDGTPVHNNMTDPPPAQGNQQKPNTR